MANANNTIWILGGVGAVAMLFLAGKKNNGLNSKENLENVLRWTGIAQQQASATGLPVEIILGVIWQESSGIVDATGSAGEKGLMQLKDIAVKDVGYQQASYQPSLNIKQGSEFLAKIKGLTGNTFDALRAYNKVGTNIGGLGAYQGSQYAREVLEKADKIKKELNQLSFTDELAIASAGGLIPIAKTITQKATSFFNGFFNSE